MGQQQVQIDATLTAGPVGSSASDFPAGNTTVPFTLRPPAKPFTRKTGNVSLPLASPSAPFALPEIGASGIITQCNTFLFRCATPMAVVVTYANPPGGDVTSTMFVDGCLLIEADAARYIKGVTVQGSGDIEYFASGNS